MQFTSLDLNVDYLHDFQIGKNRNNELSLNQTTGLKLLNDHEVLNEWRLNMLQIQEQVDRNH